jgi:Fe-S oxidoreductase
MQPHEYDPKNPRFWDPTDLRASMDKILDVCNGCRLCFNLCGSFPAIFESAERHGDDLSKASGAEVDRVVDECFQCKVCYERCPYTPDQHHPFQLDFPRLMQRSLAQRMRKEGLTARDRILGDPDGVAKLVPGPIAAIANFANENAAHRAILGRFLGISPKKKLPKFAVTRYSTWAKRRGLRSQSSAPRSGDSQRSPRRLTYFATCFVDYNAPHIGKAATAVLEHQGYEVRPTTGICCGMPKWANGDVDGASAHAAENVRNLVGLAKAGEPIVVNNPTCSMFIKEDYPLLLGTTDAKIVSSAARDLGEFLREVDRKGELKTDFRNKVGKVAYHVPCHLRAQKIGQPMEQLLAKAGAEVEPVRSCSGHDGTWSMKSEHFEDSLRYGKSCFSGMEAVEGASCASDCPLAAIQIEQATGRPVRHPAELLAEAYGLDPNKRTT